MADRVVRRGALVGLGAVWWWAVVRLALAPGAGALEGAVAAGGWGLSLLPVHCVAKGRAVGAIAAGRWRAAWWGPGAALRAGPEGEGAEAAGSGEGAEAGSGEAGAAGSG